MSRCKMMQLYDGCCRPEVMVVCLKITNDANFGQPPPWLSFKLSWRCWLQPKCSNPPIISHLDPSSDHALAYWHLGMVEFVISPFFGRTSGCKTEKPQHRHKSGRYEVALLRETQVGSGNWSLGHVMTSIRLPNLADWLGAHVPLAYSVEFDFYHRGSSLRGCQLIELTQWNNVGIETRRNRDFLFQWWLQSWLGIIKDFLVMPWMNHL